MEDLKKTEEILPYRIIRDISGYETKLINFDNPEMCPRSGIIELEAINFNRNPSPGQSVKPMNTMFSCYDYNGIKYGVDMGIDAITKLMTFKSIIIQEYKQYNLANLDDAKEWAVVRNHQSLESSPRRKGKPIYRVKDHEVLAKKQIGELLAADRASEIMRNLMPEEMIEFARLLNINVVNNSLTIIQGNLSEKARKDPAYFLLKWNDVNRPIMMVLKRCMEAGIVTCDPINGWRIRQTNLTLGNDEPSCIAYLHKNTNVLISLDQESKQVTNSIETSSRELLIPKDQKDVEIDALKKQMEDQNKKMDLLLSKMSGGPALAKTPVVATKAKPGNKKSTDPAVNARRQRAKSLGIAFWWSKKIEDLEEEIQKIETLATV